MELPGQRHILSILLLTNSFITCGFAANFTAGETAISVRHETVGTSVGYSPNLPDGGFADPQRRARYQSSGIDFTYSTHRNTQYKVAIQQRQLNSLRDSFVINEIHGGFVKRLKMPPMSRYTLDIGFDARINQASEIYKNSYTAYADSLITEVRLLDPRDLRISAQAKLGIVLTNHTKVTIGLLGGLSRTQQKGISGSAQLDNNCLYDFTASSKNGSVTQQGRCGSTLAFNQFYPSDDLVDTNLGFSVNNDLSYRDYFISPTIDFEWTRGKLKLGAGYEFRQYFRPDLDERINDAGGNPVTNNQNAYASASFKLLPGWGADARVTYQTAAFLDDVPFLYTALTFQRFSDTSALRYTFRLTHVF